MNTNDGGPAFPIHPNMLLPEGVGLPPIGMSLRDYFAAKAMPALLAVAITARSFEQEDSVDVLAAGAYAIADAMLAAREAKQP